MCIFLSYLFLIGPLRITPGMSDIKRDKLNTVNEAFEENQKVEKMVNQVIGSNNENVSEEGRGVFREYMHSVRGLHNLFGETHEEPVIHNNKQTKDIRDKTTKISKKRYDCKDCDGKFTSSSALAAHRCSQSMETSSEAGSEVSISNDSNQCHICSRVCSTAHNLKQHLEMHAKEPNKEQKKKRGSYKKQFTCEYCEKRVTSLGHLNSHIEHTHKDVMNKDLEKQGTSEDDNATNSMKENAMGEPAAEGKSKHKKKKKSSNDKTTSVSSSGKEKLKGTTKESTSGKTDEVQSLSSEEVCNSQQLHKKTNSKKSPTLVPLVKKNIEGSVSVSSSGKEKHKGTTSKQKIKCDSCQVIFDSQDLFEAHKATCISALFTLEKNVSCSMCSEKFFNVGALNMHKQHSHNSENFDN